ncbi:MAG: hypothetical protein CL760_05480 [Chloroflexi bacterium]|nr:hypothetical protein [Chloroflexota bacterium]|tara:strand:+ start:50829 stop:53393 length:2565 start_codon:yes stop_codon:yes gene_type:complete
MMRLKNKGISLVESLLALTVGGAAITGVIVKNTEETEKDLTVNLIHDAIKIVYAVDHRIAIDGYDVTLWNTTSWNSLSEINKELIQKELTSENNTACSSGTWKPSLNTERDRVLIPCNLFNNRPENGVLMSAELVTDYTTLAPDDKNYIKDFNLYLSFEDEEAFRENIKNIKYAVNTFKSDSKKEISGIHNFDLHSISKNENISLQECSAAPTDCAFKLSLNRSGGFEYLKIDGSNSMVNSHLSFVETKGQSPMKCQKWTNTKTEFTGVWSLAEVDCGIGIYEGSPLLVEVAAENGTFRNIILDKKCKKYEKVSGKINESSDEVPCGILQSPTGSDTEVIQVVDKIMSETLLAKELYSKNGEIYNLEVTNLNINTATFESIVSDSTKAEELIIQNNLKNMGATIFNGEVVFNETNIDGVLNFESDLSIGGDLTVKGNSEFLKPISLKDTRIKGTLTVNKDTVFKDETNFSSLTVTNGVTNNVINVGSNVNIATSMTGTTGMSAPVGEFGNINKDLGDARTDLSKITPNGETSGGGTDQPNVGFTLKVEYSSWVNKDDIYACSLWLPEASSKPKGVTFTQSRECSRNQIRTETTYKVWEDGRPKELFMRETIERVVAVLQEREKIGTKPTGGEGEVNQCYYNSGNKFVHELDTTTNAGTSSWYILSDIGPFYDSGSGIRPTGTLVKNGKKYSVGRLRDNSYSNGIQRVEHEVCVNDVSTNTDCSYSSTNHFLEIEKGGPHKELNEFIVVNGRMKAANDPAYKKGKYISSERKGMDKFTYFELCKIKTNEVPKGNWEQTGTHCNQTNGYCSTPGKVLTGNERTKECTVGETGHYLQSVQPPWHPNHHILVLYYKCV